MRPWEIAKLTPYQVNRIYFHERTEHGGVAMQYADGDGWESDEDGIKAGWRAKYLCTEAQIDQLWNEWLMLQGYQDHLEKKHTPPEKVKEMVESKRLEIMRRRA